MARRLPHHPRNRPHRPRRHVVGNRCTVPTPPRAVDLGDDDRLRRARAARRAHAAVPDPGAPRADRRGLALHRGGNRRGRRRLGRRDDPLHAGVRARRSDHARRPAEGSAADRGAGRAGVPRRAAAATLRLVPDPGPRRGLAHRVPRPDRRSRRRPRADRNGARRRGALGPRHGLRTFPLAPPRVRARHDRAVRVRLRGKRDRAADRRRGGVRGIARQRLDRVPRARHRRGGA